MGDIVDRFRLPFLAGIILAILGALVLFYLRLPRPEEAIEIVLPSSSPTPDREIRVYVSGAVAAPGVYRLAAGNRVEDAVKAAGGLIDEANVDGVNLATRVRDEMHVLVPRKGEPTLGIGATGTAQSLSINTATADQLELLPGIGEVIAKRIVEHRNKNGPFKSIEELRDLKLVNSSTFDKIKDMISP